MEITATVDEDDFSIIGELPPVPVPAQCLQAVPSSGIIVKKKKRKKPRLKTRDIGTD